MKKLWLLAFAFISLLAVFAYHISKPKAQTYSYFAMGTTLTITIAEDKFPHEAFNAAYHRFKQVESIFKEAPDLTNPEVNAVYQQAKELQNITNNDFSVYLSDVIKLWQFDKTNKTIVKAPNKQEIIQALSSKQVNLYALAKGYGIDKAAEVLKSYNINNFIINAGGDLLVSGTNFGKQWNIGILDNNHSINCNLDSYAVATSSNLYNAYSFNGKKYGHLLNGNTGWPVQKEQTITIIAHDATTADAYSTAVFVSDSLENSVKNNKTNVGLVKQTSLKTEHYNLPNNCKLKKISL